MDQTVSDDMYTHKNKMSDIYKSKSHKKYQTFTGVRPTKMHEISDV